MAKRGAGQADMVIEWWDIDRLIPYDRNPRILTPQAITKVAESIKQFGWQQVITVDPDGVIVTGHTRREAAKLLGLKTVPVKVIRDLTPEKVRAYRIADNRVAEETSWDDDLLREEIAALSAAGDIGFGLDVLGFDMAELERMMAPEDPTDEPQTSPEQIERTLAQRFGVPPFSVLDQRQGYWQERKRAWIALGIKSEIGRGGNLLNHSATMQAHINGELPRGAGQMAFAAGAGSAVARQKAYKDGALFGSASGADPAFYAKKRAAEARLGRALTTEEFERDHYKPPEEGSGLSVSGTSVFDPVLCELAYRWFCPPGGVVLDPFAGGSVRGIVAARLGYRYHGVDLRDEQVAANRAQLDEMGDVHGSATWYTGDSAEMGKVLPKKLKVDFVFSCPPYGDLEVYSDNPADLSAMEHEAFLEAYSNIIGQAVQRLAADRFACFVVGDFRDQGGLYRNFVSATIARFEAAGARLYNEAILVSPIGSLPIRVGRQFEASRKLGKTHQNVLVFVKGDAEAATAAVGPVEFGDLPGAPAEAPPGTIAPLTPVEKHGPFGSSATIS